MSDFNIGDIVRIGKGIEWTIVEITNTNDVKIQSAKGATRYTTKDKLTIVSKGGSETGGNPDDAERINGFDVLAENESLDMETCYDPESMDNLETWNAVGEGKPYVLVLDGVAGYYKSFESAAFALSRVMYTRATISYKGKRLITRGDVAA